MLEAIVEILKWGGEVRREEARVYPTSPDDTWTNKKAYVETSLAFKSYDSLEEAARVFLNLTDPIETIWGTVDEPVRLS